MSRISRLRSMTLTLSSSSSARCWAGDSSSSATSRSKPVSRLAATRSSALPLPTYQLGSTWRRFCHSAPTTSAPAVVARLASSASESCGGPAVLGAGVDGDEERLLDGRGEVDRGRWAWPAKDSRSSPLDDPRVEVHRCSTLRTAVSCAPSRPSDQKARTVRRVSNDESTHRGHTACHRTQASPGCSRSGATLVFLGIANWTFVGKEVDVPGPAVGAGVLRDRPGSDLVLGRGRVLEPPGLRLVVRDLHQPVHADLRVLRGHRLVRAGGRVRRRCSSRC